MADGRGQRHARIPSRDGGRHLAPDAAMAHGRRLLAEGAHILDLGGKSTAPGSRPITSEEELLRLEPVVRGAGAGGPCCRSTPTMPRRLPAASSWGPGSSTTSRPCGPIPEMAAVVRDLRPGAGDDARQGRAPAARDRPAGRTIATWSREVGDWLTARVEVALAAGIDADQIVLDPGWGKFLSLDPAHSWELLARFDELVARLAPIPVHGRHLAQGLLRGAHGRA